MSQAFLMCGKNVANCSRKRSSWPRIMRDSIKACWRRAVEGMASVTPLFSSYAPCSSPAKFWVSIPRSCPMFADIWGFLCAITKQARMRRRACASSLLLKGPVGGRSVFMRRRTRTGAFSPKMGIRSSPFGQVAALMARKPTFAGRSLPGRRAAEDSGDPDRPSRCERAGKRTRHRLASTFLCSAHPAVPVGRFAPSHIWLQGKPVCRGPSCLRPLQRMPLPLACRPEL